MLHVLVLVLLVPSLLTAVLYGGAATAVLLALLGGVQLGVLLLSHALAPEGSRRLWDERSVAVRPVWAALACVSDFLALLVTLAFLVALAADRSHTVTPSPTVGGFALLGAVSALLALHHVAHRQATVPKVQSRAEDREAEEWEAEEWASFVWAFGDMSESRK
ncbi:hypothetical protein [Streptomyces marianii]|uniref:Uncharacterized protein n=1 Tax=Streptomyces marianii TaxID=1817406 RepID=A0A5R9DVP9_9ACTN|nr:hypothetical protein [Streptomyces marianii]TLQ39203.1 hypothetical protein FEF34_38030 [Streptomyces marianii]